MKTKKWMIPLVIIVVLALAAALYVSDYYRAGETAAACIEDPAPIEVREFTRGLVFDGPGKEKALIFYPGAKVEYTAYAPLMKRLAEEGMDCFLVRMPLNLAVFAKNRASEIISENEYDNWYIGGHSLGGAVAALYAADNDLDGLVLLAAYPTKEIDEPVLEVYGTCDGVLEMDKLEEGDQYLPEDNMEVEIRGGNHAQFGDYGAQKGDGKAEISAEEQLETTVEAIKEFFMED